MTIKETIEEAKKVGVKDMSWKAWFMIITIISAATVASYYGVNVIMNIDLNTRLSMVEGLLTQPINSTFYTLQKESNYIVSVVKSGATTYYTLQNGTDGTLQWYSTNKTALHVAAAGNLTDGGTIYCKNQTWTNTITLLNTVMVIESYNGTLRYYSNQGKFILPTLAADPSTATFGSEMHIWFNMADMKIKFWDGAAIQVLPSVGGGALNVTIPPTYTFWKSGSTYYAENSSGDITYGSDAQALIQGRLTAASGQFYLKASTYSLGSSLTPSDNDWLIGEGDATVLSLTASNDEVIYVGSGVNNVQVSNMKLTNSSGLSNTTGLAFSGYWCRFEKLWIIDTSVGVHCFKPLNTVDTWFNEVYVLNFKTVGWWITKADDTMFSNINIGTGNSGATACLQVDEGGSGVHWTNLHIWASATCTYGIWLGASAGLYQYYSQFANVEIEDSGLEYGLYISGYANYNTFSNLHIRGVGTGAYVRGAHNVFGMVNIHSCLVDGMILNGTDIVVDGGRIYKNDHNGITISSNYAEYKGLIISDIDFSYNSDAHADTYYDIYVYHTKYVQIHGCSSHETAVLASMNVTDCYNMMVTDCWAYDEPMLTSGDVTGVAIHNCFNMTTWIT